MYTNTIHTRSNDIILYQLLSNTVILASKKSQTNRLHSHKKENVLVANMVEKLQD